MRQFAVIAVLIAFAVPVTRFASYLTVSSLEEHRASLMEDRLVGAKAFVEADFQGIQTDLLDRAQAVAADPDARFLTETEFFGSEPPEEVESAITRFQQRHFASGPTSVELYSADFELRAWSGASILPRPDPDSVEVDMVVRLSGDTFRKALVLWMQVGRSGLVRVVRAVESTAVETSMLGYTDIDERWRSETGLLIDVEFEKDGGPLVEGAVVVPLVNGVGEELGWALILPAASEAMVIRAEERFRNVEAFWWTLLAFWLAVGLWRTVGLRIDERESGGTRLVIAGTVRLATLWALRYLLLLLDVPGRWFRPGPAEDVFDPVFLASEVGGGIARSVGDLAVTSLFLLVAALAVFDLVARYRPRQRPPSPAAIVAAAVFAVSVIVTTVFLHAELTRQSMLDTTLDFFAWTGITPEPLVLVVFGALLLSTVATLIEGMAAVVWFARWTRMDDEQKPAGLPALAFLAVFLVAVLVSGQIAPDSSGGLVPWWSLMMHFAAMFWPAYRFLSLKPSWLRSLRLRSLLITVLVSAILLYPFLYAGMAEQRRERLLEVADSFASRGDAQTTRAIRAVLEELGSLDEFQQVFAPGRPDVEARSGIRESAIQYSLVDLVPGISRATVEFIDVRGASHGGYEQDQTRAFADLRPASGQFWEDTGLETPQDTIIPISDPRSQETVSFIGIGSVKDGPDVAGWIVSRLDRETVESPLGSLFGYTDWRRTLALAEFQDGRRVRTEGEDFERYVLPTEIEDRIADEPEIWEPEEVYSRAYVTYYQRLADSPDTVVAVRARAVIPYDHLYYLLRLAIAGLWLGIPAFIIGLAARMRAKLIPARRRQYGDRVLDAFLVVGTLAVAGMGLVGQQVISRENEGAIRSRLERRLQRTEDALVRAARAGEAPYQVQLRMPTDSLAEQLGLDLAVYHGPWLDETSTPISQAGPLMGYRLPAEAYDELFIRRLRQAFVETENELGEIHTIGYKALVDESGWPRSVVAVLTFPEQARIREERARTTAYFFGALLLLLLVIMATATTLARALTGPLRRLRDGMQSVAAGRVQQPIPVESKDEVGQLVETFNLMQDQLSESRRKLAQQERELAWSEMARQVAHEIKNPLTPMKLSIQHLQRAYEEFKSGDAEARSRFASVFGRITQTVGEQIDILANIANEFSTFARLPKGHVEIIDPNKIVREAVELTETELQSGIQFVETRIPVFVEADRDELRRVLINLLRNAVQSVDGDGKVEVAARIVSGDDGEIGRRYMLCEVTDDGPGIEPDVQSRIFQPNFSTKTSGMGLGLAIAKKSIESMGGEIGFRTQVGAGSTFWIRLPLVDA